MPAAALIWLADAASEGKKVILAMLIVGLIFIAVIALGGRAPTRTRARGPLTLDRARTQAEAGGLHLHDVWQLAEELPPGRTLDDLEQALRRERLPFAVTALFALRSA